MMQGAALERRFDEHALVLIKLRIGFIRRRLLVEKSAVKVLAKQEYEALSEFRYQLRRYLHFSEKAVRAEQLTPLQYQLMLHLRGFPGRDWATVGELAERLQIQAHGAVALITRCEEGAWVRRVLSTQDKRQVEVHLTERGARVLEKLAGLHQIELRSLQQVFQVGLLASFNDDGGSQV